MNDIARAGGSCPRAALLLGALVLAALSLVLAGCAGVIEQVAPVADPPNLTGTWRGTWTGTVIRQLEMVLDRQQGSNVRGRMTIVPPRSGFTVPATATHWVIGTIGARPDGTLWVFLDVEGRTFSLRILSDGRLEGMGSSSTLFGPVTLDRL